MKYITSMGGVWRISERRFKALKRDLAKGEINLDDYGPMLGDTTPLADLEDEVYGDEEDDFERGD